MDSRYHGFFAIHAIAIMTFAQLFGTSLWFSANSTVLDLIREWHISIAGQVLAKLLTLGTSSLYASGFFTSNRYYLLNKKFLA